MKTKKIGRPSQHKPQNRMSISFTEDAWKILCTKKPGNRSEWISNLIINFGTLRSPKQKI